MSRYTIERPKFMQGIDDTRFNPRVIISCLIALAIYMIYNIAASVIGVFYIGAEVFADPSILGGSFDDIVNKLMQLIYSQPFILILLFSMALLIGLVIIEARAIEKKKLRMIGLVKTRFALKYIIGAAVGVLVLFVLPAAHADNRIRHYIFNGGKTVAAYDAVCVHDSVSCGRTSLQRLSYDSRKQAGRHVLGSCHIVCSFCDASYRKRRHDSTVYCADFSAWFIFRVLCNPYEQHMGGLWYALCLEFRARAFCQS